MAGRAGVGAGMAVRRRVAAQCGSARLAGAEVHPRAADLHAFVALPLPRVFHRGNRGDVLTDRIGHNLPRIMTDKQNSNRPGTLYRNDVPFERSCTDTSLAVEAD